MPNLFDQSHLAKELRHWERALEGQLSESPLQCPFCNTEISKGDVICPSCHRDLKDNCPYCGSIIRVEWYRCPHCNHYLG